MKNNILDSLINAFTCLPGVGNKTAKRMTYYLLQRAKDDALNLSNSLKEAVENTRNCRNCRNLCFVTNFYCNFLNLLKTFIEVLDFSFT